MTNYQTMRHHIWVLSAIAFMGMTSIAFAQASYDAVPVQQQGDVKFMTGGIGDGEREAIESVRSEYNLHITNAAADGAFVEDVTIAVKNSTGTELASIDAGPLTNVSLPAGKYTLAAKHGAATQTKTVKLGARGATKANFIWK